MDGNWRENYKMKWIYLTIIIFAQCGCASVQEAKLPAVISNNEQKDSYIKKVEEIVSESASALTAVAPTLPDGIQRRLIEGQIQRLNGVAKASVDKVKEYERIIREKDETAVKRDTQAAIKVDEETDLLWAKVEEQDKKLTEANALKELAEARELAERKTKLLFVWSSAFLSICVVGILVEAFTPFKKAGFILIGLSTLLGGVLFYIT